MSFPSIFVRTPRRMSPSATATNGAFVRLRTKSPGRTASSRPARSSSRTMPHGASGAAL